MKSLFKSNSENKVLILGYISIGLVIFYLISNRLIVEEIYLNLINIVYLSLFLILLVIYCFIMYKRGILLKQIPRIIFIVSLAIAFYFIKINYFSVYL